MLTEEKQSLDEKIDLRQKQFQVFLQSSRDLLNTLEEEERVQTTKEPTPEKMDVSLPISLPVVSDNVEMEEIIEEENRDLDFDNEQEESLRHERGFETEKKSKNEDTEEGEALEQESESLNTSNIPSPPIEALQ